MNDLVNHPPHYQHGGIETIEYIAEVLGEAGFQKYCVGNVLKYVSRFDKKGGEEDLRKAQVYLRWALDGLSIPAKTEPSLPPVNVLAPAGALDLGDALPPQCASGVCNDD